MKRAKGNVEILWNNESLVRCTLTLNCELFITCTKTTVWDIPATHHWPKWFLEYVTYILSIFCAAYIKEMLQNK